MILTEEEQEKLSDALYEELDFPIGIHELQEEYKKQFNTDYAISIWFNDMFGWAYSYAMTFLKKDCKDSKDLITDFKKWFAETKELFDKFNVVPYPQQTDGHYNEKELDFYFNENSKIGNEIVKSLNKYCNYNLNTEI